MKALKKRYLLVIFLGFLWNGAYPFLAQNNQNPDTLYKKAVRCKDVTVGIALAKRACEVAERENKHALFIDGLNLLTTYYWEKRLNDSAKTYGQYSLRVAEKYHLDSLKADTWAILGLVDYTNGDYDNAIIKYKNAILLYKHNRLINIAIAYKNMGICESELSRNTAAITHYLYGIKIFETLKDSSDLASSYNAVALCFVSLNNYPKSIEYNLKSLAIRRSLKNPGAIAQSLNNTGFAFKEHNQPDSAIFYLSKCLEMRNGEKDSSTLVLALQNLGSSWKMKGNLKKAERYIVRSLRIAEAYGMKEEIARGNLDLAEVYTTQKRYIQALNAVKITEKTAIALKLPELLMDTYADEFNLYTQKADYKNALFFDNKKNKIKDSLFTTEKNKAIGELEIKYQTNQKDKNIASLNLQNQLGEKLVAQQQRFIILLVVAAVLLLFLFLIAYNNFRIKNNANRRIQTLMQELHHRVKNNLQVLSGLFTMQMESLDDENIRNTLRENESRLASMNLIHNKLYLDHTITQIEMEEYLTKLLQHIKSSFGGDNITLKVDAEPIMLEADKAVAIGLIVNELTTNAFKYAFNDSAGEIYLGLKKEEKSKLLLVLSDNGKGLSKTDMKKGLSFGLKLVNLMVRQLGAVMNIDNNNGIAYKFEINI